MDTEIKPSVAVKLELITDLLSAFRPAKREDAVADLLSTEELLAMMSSTFRPSVNELAMALHASGYRTALMGGEFRWMMHRVTPQE